jgi:UDP-3-O-[3-hydroxymyristoyl] glucosamine N-acyltransferase
MRLKEIAQFLNGELFGDPDLVIDGVAKIEEAKKGELTFLANPKYFKFLETTNASAVLVGNDSPPVTIPHIKLADPYIGFLNILNKIYPPQKPVFRGIHSSAVLASHVKLGENITIGPLVYIGEKAEIGRNTVLYPGCVILQGVRIGNDCTLYPNVTVREGCTIGDRVTIHNGTVIGSDGFGFAPSGDIYVKIPQLGIVQIDDDVEIGANCTVDRATMGATIIKRGCKIDNLVQIAHNVIIGENTAIAAQSGISGSTKVGKNVTIAGQVGVVGHIQIGDGTILAAKSGVSKDVPAKEVWFGYPARPIMRQKKIEACIHNLPEMVKKIHSLEKAILHLEEIIKEFKRKDD